MEEFNEFIQKYNAEDNLFLKLEMIHESVQNLMAKNPALGFDFLTLLLVFFSIGQRHSSELKTLLVISKPFEDHPLMKNARQELLNVYNKKHNE